LGTPSRSGAFDQAADRRLEQFTESISFDQRLYRQDIQGSIAHARMLATQGILTSQEAEQIAETLSDIGKQLDEGKFQFRIELEDIHMHIEQELINRLGDVGRKLHTARSRNDQVNTDFRLWVRDALDRVDGLLLEIQRAFVHRCDADFDVVIPGYTHLQRAQPVLAPHYWLAYCEKFERDRQRIADCRRRVNVCGLGAAALAGTSLPIDRQATATALGFEGVAANSLDVSSDRDFVLETAYLLANIAIHLSGLAEEWIIWSTVEFNFIQLPHEFCTGSSIMPQKINPDILELIRGKTARVVGNLQTLFVLVKGLPLAYNRDLQEDKPPLFDSFDTVSACLEIAAPVIRGATLNRDSIDSRIEAGYLDATTLMEWLIKKGYPQRTAHSLVGTLVRVAMEQKVPLKSLSLETLQSIDSGLTAELYEVLGVDRAINAFVSYGSTAPEEVRKQIIRWKSKLSL
jgi:argininosuccinate lyase